MIDGMKLVVLGGTVETARRVASSGWYAVPPVCCAVIHSSFPRNRTVHCRR